MTYKLVITREAEREYEQIVAYLAKTLGSRQAASHFISSFAEKIELVRQNPKSHPPSHLPELAAQGYRSMAAMRYVALFKIKDGNVFITHIFHQSQDYAWLV